MLPHVAGHGGTEVRHRQHSATHLSASVIARGPDDTRTLPHTCSTVSGAPFTKYHSVAAAKPDTGNRRACQRPIPRRLEQLQQGAVPAMCKLGNPVHASGRNMESRGNTLTRDGAREHRTAIHLMSLENGICRAGAGE